MRYKSAESSNILCSFSSAAQPSYTLPVRNPGGPRIILSLPFPFTFLFPWSILLQPVLSTHLSSSVLSVDPSRASMVGEILVGWLRGGPEGRGPHPPFPVLTYLSLPAVPLTTRLSESHRASRTFDIFTKPWAQIGSGLGGVWHVQTRTKMHACIICSFENREQLAAFHKSSKQALLDGWGCCNLLHSTCYLWTMHSHARSGSKRNHAGE
jgi:hypothetical protein